MANLLGFLPHMYLLKRCICQFGQMPGPLKSVVGFSALALVLSGLGWALYGPGTYLGFAQGEGGLRVPGVTPSKTKYSSDLGHYFLGGPHFTNEKIEKTKTKFYLGPHPESHKGLSDF